MDLKKTYQSDIEDLKLEISRSREKAVFSVNKELILLYWKIGKKILEMQEKEGWGTKVIDQISLDLRNHFPEIKGFGTRNLKYMRKFAEEYRDLEFVQAVLAQLPWYHNITLLDKVSNENDRAFYIVQAVENSWSRNTMVRQIETKLHERQGQAITNFKSRLLSPQSGNAQNALKDPYIFDFLSISDDAQEREIEKTLVSHMERFIMELGVGFSFVGRQYHLEVGDQDFYVDLLFYHLKLRCFIVVELKDTNFKPEYAGKMNFYLSVVDDTLKHESDQPSIGLILCKNKNNVLAEYALRDMTKPIGLAEYNFTKGLPENLKTALPTIAELEEELEKDHA